MIRCLEIAPPFYQPGADRPARGRHCRTARESSGPQTHTFSHPTPEILPWELGRCTLMYPDVLSRAHAIALR